MAINKRRPRWTRDPDHDFEDWQEYAKLSAEINHDQVEANIKFINSVIAHELRELIGDVYMTSWNLNVCNVIKGKDGSVTLLTKDSVDC